MARIKYQSFNFKPATLDVIHQANEIVNVYAEQGYDLTLRQLYYQFVARDLIANKQSEYKRLGSIINDARLAGLIDWQHITDRTRELEHNSHWDSVEEIIEQDARVFRFDTWKDQKYRIEVWVEKEALAGVFERVCRRLDIAWFSCRGYVSQSELWGAAMRLRSYSRAGQTPVILHFGDHDPSGIDMTRDIEDRMAVFGAHRVEVRRLALNMEQVEEYGPPPNPAKTTDSRFEGYAAIHGDESWELDALEPSVLAAMVTTEVEELREEDKYNAMLAEQAKAKKLLQAVSDNWWSVTDLIESNGWLPDDEDEDETTDDEE